MASGNRRRALVIGGGFSGLFAAHDLSKRKMGIKFLWGEVKQLDGSRLVAHVKPMFSETTEEVPFDYCIIAAGCNFGVFHKYIFEEHEKLKTLNKKKASVVVVGAG
ncbi:hypothetical protein Pmar_PMAR006727 [Perkinsus marinus ATCC 50983]|uniref:Flavin-containing monooxygenase n=1 Tax=Perkinsus marinus (strain ATCC 50983 / TXsc) TaxID=423536 RepID=C5K6B5_PERM5|nr:hypothetical protein Pmar_PMAR006727 [Perkinsus marinus ATCC 50983]EER19835.1 hypothetical protein Pmar_PMAR006727 [Perkinsus marinus ATCC 50983]|eukprot:XP_002788039.1 hypothetical protein Pmar_PMAR006727 [Perkinsus marinus ATCC 50983]